MKKLIKLLNNNNTVEFNLQKTIEELTELNLELIHHMTKTNLNNKIDIMKEVVDVEIRLKWLKNHLNMKSEYKQRKIKKIKHLLKNVINKRCNSK